MKFILRLAISSVCLMLLTHDVSAQAQTDEPQLQCQLRAQQPRTDETNEALSSTQVRLANVVETVCQLNGQQPRTDDGAIATAETPSPEDFTVPSLWWQEQQVGEAINSRLIDSWRAYHDTNSPHTDAPISHVDVVINSQLWPLLNYLERYSLITQFGETAKYYEYQLRLFTGNRLVGLQVCDFAANTHNQHNNNDTDLDNASDPSPHTCVVELNYFGQGAIRGGRQPLTN